MSSLDLGGALCHTRGGRIGKVAATRLSLRHYYCTVIRPDVSDLTSVATISRFDMRCAAEDIVVQFHEDMDLPNG